MPAALPSEIWPADTAPDAAFRDEADRAPILAAFDLDSFQEDVELAGIASLAAMLCDAPLAMVTIVEGERVRVLARNNQILQETGRAASICAHTMGLDQPLVVPDARRDERFRNCPMVTGAPFVRFYAGAPIISREGASLGALCVLSGEARDGGLAPHQLDGLKLLSRTVMRRMCNRRLTVQMRSALNESERRFRRLAETMPQIAWSSTADGVIDYTNSRFVEFTGVAPRQSVDWHHLVHPDDYRTVRDAFVHSIGTGEPLNSEFRLRNQDGSWRWFLSRANPARGRDGAVERWFGTLTDIDDNHRLLVEGDLMTRELSHRIKNIFAVVGSLAALKARHYPEAALYADDMAATIQTLARAHALVSSEKPTAGQTLHRLMHEVVSPFATSAHDQVVIAGEDIDATSRSATPLALTFHELATNAVKYGALASVDGQIGITTRKLDSRIEIVWHESGGPPPPEPRGEGFGTRVINVSMRNQLGATLARDWREQGLVVTLQIPQTAI